MKSLILNGLILLVSGSLMRAQSPVFINEVLANNASLADLDGRTPDWVELYNASANEVDLAGWSFTSDPANSRRWVFPNGTPVIRPQSFRVVYFASNQDASPRNTGFGLNANGDAVYLYNASGQLADSVVFGLQVADYALGRAQVAGGAWTLTRPTLEGANVAEALGNPRSLRINEWLADANGGGDWFEIYNPEPNPVALGGLYLSNALNKNPYKHQIAPLSFIGVGARGYQQFMADEETTSGAHHVNFKLAKEGDEIGLFPATGSVIHFVTFTAQLPGISQGLLPDGGTIKMSFSTSVTPGASNYLPIPSVVVNEILTHTDPPLQDAVELYNQALTEAAIGGWYLSDSQSNFKKYKIPAGTTIPARGYRVFYEEQFTNSIPFHFNSAEGDSVYLSEANAADSLTGYRAVVRVGPAANGVSFGRYTNSALVVQYPAQVSVTLGAANAGPTHGPVVLSEIMFYPFPPVVGTNDNTLDEFIELYNIASSPVALYDPAQDTNTWRIRSAVDYDFPPRTTLLPGECLLLVSFNPTDQVLLTNFKTKYNVNNAVAILGPYKRKLGNTDDTVDLERPDPIQGQGHINEGLVPYVLVERIAYSSVPPWPTGANGSGKSLQRKDTLLYGDDPANWEAATPTAGQAEGASPINLPPKLAAIGRTQDGSFQLQISGPAGATWILQSSTDLRNWSPVATYTSPNGVWDYQDAASSDTRRFYRITVE